MSPEVDVVASIALVFLGAAALAGHRLVGRPQFPRVTQQGGTVMLGRDPMNTGYWLLQPAITALAKAGVPPAALSWLSVVPALLGAIGASWGHWGLVAWLLLASALLDVLDGAVARVTGRSSAAGAILDSTLDRYAEFALLAGISFFYRGNESIQLIVLAALLGSFLVTYSTAKAEALGLTPPRGFMKRSDRLALLVSAAVVTPILNHFLAPGQSRHAWPMLAATAGIAIFANVSAITRMAALARPHGA